MANRPWFYGRAPVKISHERAHHRARKAALTRHGYPPDHPEVVAVDLELKRLRDGSTR
jgi:hypothetical protein